MQVTSLVIALLLSIFAIFVPNSIYPKTNALSLVQRSQTQDATRRTTTTITATKNITSTLSVPFLILMSEGEVSVAKLPLIDDGSVSVVYQLDGSHSSQDGEEEEAIGTVAGADAREYEQMPGSFNTSLGKSEWSTQSVATTTRTKDREEVWPMGSRKKDDNPIQSQDASRDIRARRSSGLSNDDEARNGNDRISAASNKQQEEETRGSAASGESGLSESAAASSNTTSAQFSTSGATRIAIGRREANNNNNHVDAASSSSRSSSSPSAEALTGAVAPETSAVQFCDFDVHMSLGYAFVADTSGRVHRFRLMQHESSKLEHETAENDDDEAHSNEVYLAKNSATDYANSIDAQQQHPLRGPKSSSHSAGNNNALHKSEPHDDAHDDRMSASSGAVAGCDADGSSSSLSDANSGCSESSKNTNRLNQNDDATALERTSNNTRQHPTISGAQQWRQKSGHSTDSFVASGLHQASGAQQTESNNRTLRFARKAGIIWSRSKAHGRANGAVPINRSENEDSYNQVVNGTTTGSNSERQLDNAANNEQLEQPENAFTSDQHHSVTNSTTSETRSLKTEVAVDWLSNLLFVLDKYRIIVMDFDGNNELVLVDDFNANNRPIELKVDPINDFLFWLQMGKFHNTIYKLDLGVVSSKLRPNDHSNDQTQQALVSHHYAHPIITNLPPNAKLFTIDHKHSKIYVPLAPTNIGDRNSYNDNNNYNDYAHNETEVFAPNDESNSITHLNSTQLLSQEGEGTEKDCVETYSSTTGQILAYNLDGTDVGPFRSNYDTKHLLPSLSDMQDLTMDSKNGYLYWLSNQGREVFEEYKYDKVGVKDFYSALHNLGGKSYLKLMHFHNDGSNQPVNMKPRFNLRKLIHILSPYGSVKRETSLDGSGGELESLKHSSDFGSSRFSRNAPYIILGITCLIVLTVYLIYALVFQQVMHRDNNGRNESIDGSSMSGSQVDNCDTITNGFVGTNTISHWISRPSGSCSPDNSSTFNRNNGGHIGSPDVESTNYEVSNAVDDHYKEENVQRAALANLRGWPTNMHDVSNKLYVPVEVLCDDALSSIRRVSIDQLEIENHRPPLGEGHFGTVVQGTIKCTLHQKTNMLNKSLNEALLAPSTASSGHGSSSTSSEFVTANSTNAITNSGDYLTPKSNCNSAMSDYAIENGSCGDSYCNSGDSGNGFVKKPDGSIETKWRVAIKKLRPNASIEEKRDFLQEAKLLANFDHPNIVHLIGICLDRGSALIVMELMLGGDLIRYMQENVPTMSNPESLTQDDLLNICLDIVNGCCYLEELNYIHRDLAARNCLVSSRKREERVVKLADFGLARDIYKDSYYKKLNDSAMPLKWMAPECLIEQKFTTMSDVWSFGVVLWEVMSYCQKKPYDRVDSILMKEYLIGGARLMKPTYCNDDMYRLMNQCWQLEPKNRPTFHECRATLIEIKSGGVSQNV